MAVTVLALAVPVVLHATDRGRHHARHARTFAMAAPSDADTAPRRSGLTEGAAREWLARYQQAWETRDIAALSALGVIRPDQQAALRRALDRYARLDVAVSNETIAVEGGRALLSFDRTDTDETGKQLRFPRQTVRLEQMPEGVVSTWHDRSMPQ